MKAARIAAKPKSHHIIVESAVTDSAQQESAIGYAAHAGTHHQRKRKRPAEISVETCMLENATTVLIRMFAGMAHAKAV